MTLYVKGTNIEIEGTLETVRGVALTLGLEEDGSPIYAGETKIWWDEQRTVMHGNDRVWIGSNGTTYLQSQIEDREDTP